jgi:HEPN domain-containing protein
VPDARIYRKDLKALAELRAAEARVLLSRGKQQGAYYLAGYAVECALKACIAKQTKRFEFPPKRRYIEKVYSHDLGTLLDAAGLDAELEKEVATNRAFAANRNTVKDWNEESRYRISGLNGTDLCEAVTGPSGVLPWIRLRW